MFAINSRLILFMWAIAEWLLFGVAATAEFKIGSTLDDIAFAINKVGGSGKAHRTAFRVAIDLGILAHS